MISGHPLLVKVQDMKICKRKWGLLFEGPVSTAISCKCCHWVTEIKTPFKEMLEVQESEGKSRSQAERNGC
jgi:hypothetical protein